MDRLSSAPEHVLADLARLQRDQEPAARRIGAALTATVLSALADEEERWVGEIEALRSRLEASSEIVDVALPNSRGVVKPAEVGDTCRRRSKKQPWGSFLLTLARTVAPERCLELGTCLGISSAYLAAGMTLAGRGHLDTLEGATALADHSRQNLASLGFRQVEVVPGLFAATLERVLDGGGPIELAFIDGHHQEEPTLRYFEQIVPYLTEPAIVVFDDIRWSEGMERAWAALARHTRVHVAVDLTSVGVCVVGSPSDAALRLYQFPTVSAMQPSFPKVSAEPISVDAGAVTRLNWTLEPKGEPGWLNVAPHRGPEIAIAVDVRQGLPLDDGTADYVVSMQALPATPYMDVPAVLEELCRVLKPGGTLRLGVPDLEHSLDALRRGDGDAFVVSDRDAETLTGKFITQVLWYGLSASLFTAESIAEQLLKAGFSYVHRCALGQTATPDAAIVALDDGRPGTLFVEAVK